MSGIQTILDVIMCIMWLVTYTLVLIGTVKYHYPLISPITQAIIAPFEFAVLIHMIMDGRWGLDYVSLAYTLWSVIELVIIIQILKLGIFTKNRGQYTYILTITAVTGLMYWLIACKGQMYFFSYFNTFIGEAIWLSFIFSHKDYPMKPLVLVSFTAKFTGDLLSIFVYVNEGIWLSKMICVMLPMLDLLFIALYFSRTSRNRKKKRS